MRDFEWLSSKDGYRRGFALDVLLREHGSTRLGVEQPCSSAPNPLRATDWLRAAGQCAARSFSGFLGAIQNGCGRSNRKRSGV